jgi:hypothetical protein
LGENYERGKREQSDRRRIRKDEKTTESKMGNNES